MSSGSPLTSCRCVPEFQKASATVKSKANLFSPGEKTSSTTYDPVLFHFLIKTFVCIYEYSWNIKQLSIAKPVVTSIKARS